MKTYTVSLKFSNDKRSWHSVSVTVKAESDFSAMELAKSKYSRYEYVEVTNVR